MTDPICVLALDAADYELVKHFNCENILQTNHRSIEVFSHEYDVPQTTEIWPTVATGVGPADHGLSTDVREWDSQTLRYLSIFTSYLPMGVRKALGRIIEGRGANRTIQRVADDDHIFDEAYGWPGLTDADHLRKAWKWCTEAEAGNLTTKTLDRRLRAHTGQEFGWLVSMSRTDTAIIGVHSHVLDVAGHLYANQPDLLQEVYRWVDDLVGLLRANLDKLVILSDHGIQNVICDDSDLGNHSWRAMISVDGVSGALPKSVYDVRKWLEAESTPVASPDEQHIDVGPARKHLSELGYLDE
ncbi:alkaline phosphatase family protein [Halovivax cerinus]|uniref:Alkaline phosphatase family protein n=1 Tax=Halovivax cerinus TaxID=1487865 RepID=A0ABD5NJU3_9EURY|nr:alkaline phosphatase family protein [Halovivax cerinus]